MSPVHTYVRGWFRWHRSIGKDEEDGDDEKSESESVIVFTEKVGH